MAIQARTFLTALAAPLLAVGISVPALAGHDFDDNDYPRKPRHGAKSPKVVLISLDGAKPDLIDKYVDQGVLPWYGALAKLSRGSVARQNVTATPSLTAVSHIAIATGSTAANNDIPANTFHAVAQPIAGTLSGFAAAIGGYQVHPLDHSHAPTAEPLWVRLRQQGKKVVAATWPGADGADIRINGIVVQSAVPTRVTDYAVPFGAFGGLGARGFNLTVADFAPDSAVAAQLQAAGHFSFSPVKATPVPFESFSCASTPPSTCSSNPLGLNLRFDMRAAAIDTTNDGVVNYDTLVIFESTQGVQPGPFQPPSTGAAVVKLGGPSAPFFFEGSGNKVGAAYFVSALSPDLTTVRFARYGANFIPRNAAVIANVDV